MNILEILRQRAEEPSAGAAYTFLSGEHEECVSYRALNESGRRIGARLKGMVAPGERVILLHPPGLSFISSLFGCFYSQAIAVPAYPPSMGRSGRNLNRLRSIIADARPRVALCSKSVLSIAQPLIQSMPELSAIRWLCVEDIVETDPSMDEVPVLDEQAVAFLQYTSGSTSNPKGVMITHGNLMHNSRAICSGFGHSSASRGVIWLPPYHDMGLIGGILQPLYAGFPVVLMPPTAFLQRPYAWLKAISDFRGTTSGGPNSAFDLCVQRITDEEKSSLNLSCWNVAFSGAEPVRLKTIEAFTEAFACCGFQRDAFLPCYGLAEATLMVTGFRERSASIQPGECSKDGVKRNDVQSAGAEESETLVACGSPDASMDLRIVVTETQTLAEAGALGEIWVAGPSVGAGYWAKPELSRETFSASLPGSTRSYLRTGDLGMIVNGRLRVAGRIKDLIIIRGTNYYPDDIELTVAESHPDLKGCTGAAFSVEVAGQERLVIAHEVSRRFKNESANQVLQAVRAAVANEHELAVHAIVLVRPGRLPKTSSGKIQRYLCRELFLKNELDAIAVEPPSAPTFGPATLESQNVSELSQAGQYAGIEQHLRKLLQSILKVETLPPSGEFDFCHAGLDSLMLVDFQHRIIQDFGVRLPHSLLFEIKSVAQLASEIRGRIESQQAGQKDARRGADVIAHPLSCNQRALWFLYQLEPEDPAYNIVAAAKIQGELDRNALFAAFKDICARHESLHTKFGELNDDPVRVPQPELEPLIISEDASAWSEQILESRMNAAARVRFDLKTESPVKVFLFSRNARDHVLVWVTHHIASDFWSFRTLFSELEALYRAHASGQRLTLPAVGTTYDDFVFWEADLLQSSEGARLRDFWKGRIRTIPHLNLPGRHRAAERKPGGATHIRKLDPEFARDLREAAVRAGLTMNEFCLAAFETLLYRYTGSENIVLGIPSSGRADPRFRELVGYCVSPLLISVEMNKEMSFAAVAKQVRQHVRDALDHQNYPLPLVFEGLEDRRDSAISTGMQIMFVFQKTSHLGDAGPFVLPDGARNIRWGDLSLQPFQLSRSAAQFEMMLAVTESENELHSSWQYRTDLFEAVVIERMAEHWENLLHEIVRNPEKRTCDLEILGPRECQRSIVEWNSTAVEYGNDKCLHQLFEQQVERTPDTLALVYEQQKLSYRELNARANQLAHHLRRHGVGPEVVVPVCMLRSVEIVIALLGVLKSGGAYLPLDPTDPAERLSAIVAETKAPVVLTQERFAPMFAACGRRVLNLDGSFPNNEAVDNANAGCRPDNLAYVIYTSGSTGFPKGAMNTHRGICNRLLWMQEMYGLNGADRVLQKTPYTFDVSVWEFFWPLISGARLVLARPGEHRDPAYLATLIQDQGITTLHFVPSMLRVFLEEAKAQMCFTLKRVICSGEALPFELTRRFHDRINAELHNLYGPTEASVDVTFWECPKEPTNKVVPIGKPIANTQVYVLDSQFDLAPIGVNGEIYLGGVGVGRGYWGRADLTAERFVPSPFGAGHRLYRTGDVGRYMEDGNVEWIGRTDHQVKIRGHRIELGEIEGLLNAHEKVRESVVVAREDSIGTQQLVAYVILRNEDAISSLELRVYLVSKLPDYMVPSTFITVREFPFTRSGKVDRGRLPIPDGSEARETEYVAPRTPTEEGLVRIWEEVLGQRRIGIHDNFFHIGGHSLLMARIAGRIRSEWGVEVPMTKFFQGPTIAQLAEVIIRQTLEEKNADDISALLDQLENLSADEVEQRLQKMSTVESVGKGATKSPQKA